MLQKNEMLILNLMLFDDGGAVGGTGSATGEASGETAQVAVGQTGETPTEGEEAQTAVEQPPVDRKAQYAQFKAENKDLFDEEVQGIVKNRLKKAGEAENKLKSLDPVISMLSQKYGVSDGDAESLLAAIENDNSYFEEEAIKKGMSVEQLKEIKKLQRDSAELERVKEETRQKEFAENLYKKWVDESKTVKQKYPAFDLRSEMQNQQFLKLLNVPSVDVMTAFELVHRDEILPAAMQMTAQKVEQKVINNIKANGMRPSENSTGSSPAVNSKIDPSTMTATQREDLYQRALRGEKITFGN